MIYLDTSFLTPLFRQEETSAQVSDFLALQPTGTLAVSKWTAIEFASLISRDVRMGLLKTEEGKSLVSEFNAMLVSSLVVYNPSSHDFDLAQEYVSNFSTHLRGPDAIHLAIAHNNEVDFIATLDEGMLSAAKKLKVKAKRVIR